MSIDLYGLEFMKDVSLTSGDARTKGTCLKFFSAFVGNLIGYS
jgi:hypothetical protein